MDKERIVNIIKEAQKVYRDGNPILSDRQYDDLVEQLRSIDPTNPLINTVEAEEFDRPTVKHPKPMLSTEKVFDREDLQKWFNRIEKKHGKQTYRITPKLDGMSARVEGDVLTTRGDGEVGYDITDAWNKGLTMPYDDYPESCLGEIVMSKSYFESRVKEKFDHPRNCIVGAMKCDVLSDIQKQILQDKAIHFVPYSRMTNIIGTSDKIMQYLDHYIEILSDIDYPIDGFVIEVTDNDELKKQLGHTSHHYRWQVAYKTVTETAETTVNDITWQVGRGGNITPVLEVEPVKISGAVVRRVTGHNYGYLQQKGIGIGSQISIIRSGEVIPKVMEVLNDTQRKSTYVYNCPECNSETVLVNDIISCPNFSCPAQVVGRLRHFFKTLKIDGFGNKTLETLVENGYDTLQKILSMSKESFIHCGFGPGQSKNLINSMRYSISEQKYEDWKILAAISIPLLGKSEAKKLLKYHNKENLFELTEDDIISIEGFAEKKAKSVIQGIDKNRDLIELLISSFIITNTKELEGMQDSVLQGKMFVFTGKMNEKRDDLFDKCTWNGGEPQKSITKATDYLVTSDFEKAGQSKLTKAEKYGIKTITESEFMSMIGE